MASNASELDLATAEAKEWLASFSSIDEAWAKAERPDLLLWLRRQQPLSPDDEKALVRQAFLVAGPRRQRKVRLHPPTELELASGWVDRDVPPGASLQVLFAPLVVLGPLLVGALVAINLLGVPRGLKAVANVALPAAYPLLMALHHTVYTAVFRRRVRAMSFDDAFTALWLAARRSVLEGRSAKANEISLAWIRRYVPLPERAST